MDYCLKLTLKASNHLKQVHLVYLYTKAIRQVKLFRFRVITPGKAFDEACDYADYQPVKDLFVNDVPAIKEPEPRTLFDDPVFSTCLVRVTDRKTNISPGDNAKGLKNEYSRVQSLNVDGSLLLSYSTDGNWYLYDAISLQPVGQLPIWHEPRWDADDLDLLYYSEETRLMSYRISNAQKILVHEIVDEFTRINLAEVWMKYEGNPSMDSRYWGLMADV